jgi:predicted lipoprotein with Yx(FWY)xxD motif
VKDRIRPVSLVALCTMALLVAAAPAMAASNTAQANPLVSKLEADNLDATVLARANGQALYYWSRERNGKIRCVGSCAEAWPPYFVGKNKTIPRKIAGYDGTFGKVRRPDGRYQLTYNRLPLYTYAHEGRGVVLCDDVNGWFAIRL